MNYSPLNDPGFNQKRNEERKRAAAKRRRTTLIILSTVTLLVVLCGVLLTMALAEAFPDIKDFFQQIESDLQPDKPDKPDISDLPDFSSPPEQSHPSLPQSEQSDVPPVSSPAHGNSSPAKTSPSENESSLPNMHTTTIYVDAGHGFTNSYGVVDFGSGDGSFYHTLSGGLYEADLNLILALKVQKILEENGYVVIMSRTDYVYKYLPITKRAENAVATQPDCIISIHANSAAETARGTRVYYCNRIAASIMSKTFARNLTDAVNADPGLSAKSVLLLEDHEAVGGTAGYVMCNSTGQVPSALIETCFITNEQDAQNAISEEWQDRMAAAIAKAIMETFECKTSFLPQ